MQRKCWKPTALPRRKCWRRVLAMQQKTWRCRRLQKTCLAENPQTLLRSLDTGKTKRHSNMEKPYITNPVTKIRANYWLSCPFVCIKIWIPLALQCYFEKHTYVSTTNLNTLRCCRGKRNAQWTSRCIAANVCSSHNNAANTLPMQDDTYHVRLSCGIISIH